LNSTSLRLPNRFIPRRVLECSGGIGLDHNSTGPG
jgi:hypothetical protein